VIGERSIGGAGNLSQSDIDDEAGPAEPDVRLRDAVVLITGASSGIGRATAIELARAGCRVALAARRVDRLEETASRCRESGGDVVVRPTDVARRDECFDLVAEVTSTFGNVDILINNAGFALLDPIESADIDDVRRMIETNLLGTLHCTQAVLPQMLERRHGAIVNVSSITGLMGYAGMGMYGATKFAMTGMTEALRDEVIDRGVRVILVCPGATSSEFFLHAEQEKIHAAARLVSRLGPEDVAKSIRKALERGTYRVIVPFAAHLYIRFKELAPRAAHYLMRRVSSAVTRKGS
jgi:NADP-dependent 3-hydroxy acid dehydrogenase YdfG